MEERRQRPHILVVDDSLTVRMELRAALSEAGFRVTACDSLAWAERAIRLQAFGAVLLDVVLPDGSGIDLLRRIRGDADLSALPVILLSSRAEVASRIEGLSTGADEYIGKPYDRAYLIERVRQVVGARAPSRGAAPPPEGRKLLVVDDSPTFLETLAAQLRDDGHEVVLARSGREALELLEVEPVDCVLLDVIMPDLDGIEVCQRIRRIPGREDTPVLLMTATADPVLRSQARAASARALALKTPGLDLLRAELRRVLEQREGDPPPQAEPDEPPSSTASRLLEQVIAASGLSRVIARGAIERACRRAGVQTWSLGPPELQRALPAIEEALVTFLPEAEAGARIRSIAALARLSLRSAR